MKLSNMKVCSEEIELTEDQWEELRIHSCFTHGEACEEILYVPSDDDFFAQSIEPLKELPLVVETIKEARKQGYTYICFYA